MLVSEAEYSKPVYKNLLMLCILSHMVNLSRQHAFLKRSPLGLFFYHRAQIIHTRSARQ